MTPRVLVDINVLLDVLGERHPHYEASSQVWAMAERGKLVGMISANSVTTLYYLLRRVSGHATALRGVTLVCEVFRVLPVDEAVIARALRSSLPGFEDAVQYENARRSRVGTIVTRDIRHFRKSAIPVLSPESFLQT